MHIILAVDIERGWYLIRIKGARHIYKDIEAISEGKMK